MIKSLLKPHMFLLYSTLVIIFVIAGLAFEAKEKEEKRNYIIKEEIVLKQVISEEKELKKTEWQKSREIEEINNSVSTKLEKIINQDELDDLKQKALLENKINNFLVKNWNKPFNYKEGSTCTIDLYDSKSGIDYKIYECSSDAIFIRSIEISIQKLIESNLSSNIKKYNKKNKLSLIFLP